MSKERRDQLQSTKEPNQELHETEVHAPEHTKDMPAWDPREGFADLKARIQRGERASAPGMEDIEEEDRAIQAEEPALGPMPAGKPRRIRWKMVAVLAAALVLTLVWGVGAIGERVHKPAAVTELKDGEVIIKINNDERIASEVEEEEIYEEIEERLGILSLRLGYKPVGMELHKVEILEEFGEVRIEFLYEDKMFALYMSRNYQDVGIGVKSDGTEMIVDTIDNFWLKQQLDVMEVENSNSENVYLVRFEKDNATYVIDASIAYEEFEKIIQEIYLKNV